MNQQIEIEFVAQNKTLIADLLWDENPALCKQLLAMLPYTSLQMHTMVSGKNIYHLLPELSVNFSDADKPVSRVNSCPGSIFMYYPRLLLIKYGKDFEDRSFPRIAQIIPEHIEYLDSIGKSCWDNININKIPNMIRISQRNKIDVSFLKEFKNHEISNKSCSQLIADIIATVKSEWLQPSSEILDFYTHNMKQEMGSYGVKTPTAIFAEGEVRHIVGVAGFGIVDAILRSCKKQENVDLQFTKEIFTATAKGPAFFLGFCGLKTFQEYLIRTMDVMHELEYKEDLISLLEALSLYGNMVHMWHMHYFPWQEEATNYA